MKFKVVKETEVISRSDDEEHVGFNYKLKELFNEGEDFNESELTLKTRGQVLTVGSEYELRLVSEQARLTG